METYHKQRYDEAGIPDDFVQDNYSHSTKGILRGLHYQIKHPQGKLVQVVKGEVFDVAVDIRMGSPTFGRWFGATLSADNHKQLYVPAGFAHGFCVTSDEADFLYKCTDYYHPEDEGGVIWSDPNIAITWPVENPQISQKDINNIMLKDVHEDELPKYKAQS